MKNFYIKTEKGFYSDFIQGSFVNEITEAHGFSNYTEAAQFKKALEVMDGIKEALIVEDDPELDKLLNLAKKYVQEAEINAAVNPSSHEIQVVIVDPGEKPYKKIIPNTAAAFNDVVAGGFGMLNIGRTTTGASVAIHLNDDGKLIGLPFNRRIIGKNHVSDIIVGSFFISAYNMQGDNISLNDQEADYYIKRFTSVEVYL